MLFCTSVRSRSENNVCILSMRLASYAASAKVSTMIRSSHKSKWQAGVHGLLLTTTLGSTSRRRTSGKLFSDSFTTYSSLMKRPGFPACFSYKLKYISLRLPAPALKPAVCICKSLAMIRPSKTALHASFGRLRERQMCTAPVGEAGICPHRRRTYPEANAGTRP
eukprot:scaffold1528_cov198-Pinguiococcus_pyrenoidosus.AAC.17